MKNPSRQCNQKSPNKTPHPLLLDHLSKIHQYFSHPSMDPMQTQINLNLIQLKSMKKMKF
jgi:hypothetical protein